MNQLEKLDLIHALAHKQKRVEMLDDDEWIEIVIDIDGDVQYVVNEYGDWDVLGTIGYVLEHELRELYVPFKPKMNDRYYFWDMRIKSGNCVVESGMCILSATDLQRIAFGNCFRSEEECLAHPEIKEKLEAIRKELE